MKAIRTAIVVGLVLLFGGIAVGCSSGTATSSTATVTATATVTVTEAPSIAAEVPSAPTSETSVPRVPYIGNVLYPESGPSKFVTWNEELAYCDIDYAQTSLAVDGTVEVYGNEVRLNRTSDGVELRFGDVDVLAVVVNGTKVGVVTDRGSEQTTLSLHTADWGQVQNLEICRGGM